MFDIYITKGLALFELILLPPTGGGVRFLLLADERLRALMLPNP